MAYQLCTRDEYRQLSILEVGDNVDALIAKARQLVTNENMENALTMTEKEKDFTFILPEFLDSGDATTQVVYAGKNGRDQHMVLLVGETIEDSDEVRLSELAAQNEDMGVQFYIGTTIIDRKKELTEDYYAKTPRGDVIGDIDDTYLEGKTVFFIKKI